MFSDRGKLRVNLRELSRVCDNITNIRLKTMLLRISMLVRKKEESRKSGLTKDIGGTCEICLTRVECLAEFNRRFLCTRCFERMIRIRVGGRADTVIPSQLDTSRKTSVEEDTMLAV